MSTKSNIKQRRRGKYRVGIVLLAIGLLLPSGAFSQPVSATAVKKIACVGDSITRGSNASKAANAYPGQLAEMLGSGYQVENFGDSGKTLLKNGVDNGHTPASYWDGKYFKQSKAYNPDYVIIMIGSNDAKPVNWDAQGNKDNFVRDFKELIGVYKALPSHPTVLVATSPTAYKNAFTISDAVVSGEIVPLQKQIAQETGCQMIDINAKTKNMSWNFEDGLHPNDNGYRLLAAAFAESFGVHIDVDPGKPSEPTSDPGTPSHPPVSDWTTGGGNVNSWPSYSDGFLTDSTIISSEEPDDDTSRSDDSRAESAPTVQGNNSSDSSPDTSDADSGAAGKKAPFWIVMIGGPVVLAGLAAVVFLVLRKKPLAEER